MKGFWNDEDGLTVVDILAIVLGLGSMLIYWKFGSIDGNFADIVVAAVVAAAGQKVGMRVLLGRRSRVAVDVEEEEVAARASNRNQPPV